MSKPRQSEPSPPRPTAADKSVDSVDLRDLGVALRVLRNDKGVPLSEAAAETGLSPSFISLVESGKSDISFGRLIRLTDYYGVGLSDLLPNEAHKDAEVVRKKEQRSVTSPGEGIEMFLLAPDVHRSVMPLLVTYKPHGHTAEFTSHPGEEFIYVMDGVISLRLEGREPKTLHRGDSAYFKSLIPHALSNPGDSVTWLIAMIAPPTW
jgi:quercetin dioxygenase-like cupin family protein